MKEKTKFSHEDWVIFYGDILSGIKHIHDCGYLHNDIKEDNILIWKNDVGIWKPIIIDFSEGCLITKARSRKYRSNHKHIDPAVLRGDDPHSVHNDLYGYVILIKNIIESINATDVLVEKINEWFSGNYRFTYVSIKDRLLQLNLIPAS